MFLKSLQWRLVSFFCVIAFSLVIPIGFFLNKSVEDTYYNSFTNSVQQFLSELTLLDTSASLDVYEDIKKTKAQYFYVMVGDTRSITVVNVGNNDVHSSDNRIGVGASAFLRLQDSKNFMNALGGKIGDEKRVEHLKDSDENFFDYAQKIPETNFLIYFRYYSDDWRATLDAYNNVIYSSLMISLVIAFIFGYMLSKTITVPIIRIMQKARNISEGDFEQVLEVKSEDEIGKLTSAFNTMAFNLKNTLAEISSEKNKIETILNYMTDGVIAFNIEGTAIHSNPAARQILRRERFDEKFIEFAQRYGLDINMEELIYLDNMGSIGNKELSIDVNGKAISIYFAIFSDEARKPEGMIAVLQDVTEKRRLETMQKEFVANVSHELKTPLTSIKTYTETLLDGCLEDKEITEKFLGVVYSEAERMTRLVQDLLQLSRIDDKQMKMNVEEIMIPELAKSSVDKMMLEATHRKQYLECYVMGDIPQIQGDYDRLEQVMMNIISNAIKYTAEGGRVTVYVSRMFNEIYIKVVDTGIGIPEKDLSRIFERFYRVDKARSREMGGTGLGLSIAKEIVEAHAGVISIKSELNKGTEVMIRLPVQKSMELGKPE